MSSLRLLRQPFSVCLFAACALGMHAEIAHPTASTPQKPSSYQALAELHLPSLSQQDMQEKKAREEIEKHNAEVIKKHEEKTFKISKKPSLNDIKILQIGAVEKLNIIYQLFSSNDATPVDAINKQLYQDLEFFCGNSPHQNDHLLSQFDTQTTMGKVELQKMLALPTTDIEKLRQRQAFIKKLINNSDLLITLEQHLANLQETESEILSFWKTSDAPSTMLFDKHYSTWFPKLNQNKYFLELSVLWQTVIYPSLIPVCLGGGLGYGLVKFLSLPEAIKTIAINKIRELYSESPTMSAVSLFYATIVAFSIYAPISNAIEYNQTSNLVQQKMISIASFSNALHAIDQTLAQNSMDAALFSDQKDINTKFSEKLQEFRTLLATNTFKGKASVFSLKGKALAAFKIMHEIKDQFAPLLKMVGKIDAFVAIAKFMKSKMSNSHARYCFADYEVATTPHLALTDFWHPRLNQDKVVTNSVEIGGNGASNIIITGPNAGGKSTVLKGIAIAIILAQTLGIVPASSMTFTPFAQTNAYLNIADTTGTASLYQAEMRRAQSLISSIKKLEKNQFSFVIMDEIFTGTNHEEGQAGAYGVAKGLAKFANNMCVMATHYKLLTELESELPRSFKNYKVSVIKNHDGSYTMPYKLEVGISDQRIALDLLKGEGFSDDIIDAARGKLASQGA
jgi:DNA mismatch repair protein MutS